MTLDEDEEKEEIVATAIPKPVAENTTSSSSSKNKPALNRATSVGTNSSADSPQSFRSKTNTNSSSVQKKGSKPTWYG